MMSHSKMEFNGAVSLSTITTTPTGTGTTLSHSICPPPPPLVLSPCAACKILCRRCVDKKCLLAPYFPPTQPLKFTIAHRVFGASNIITMLQKLPESQRDDAVSSMVYEAKARIRDPVYGSTGTICQLHKQVNKLQTELAKVHAELINMQIRQASLVAFKGKERPDYPQSSLPESIGGFTNTPQSFSSDFGFLKDDNLDLVLEPLWT